MATEELELLRSIDTTLKSMLALAKQRRAAAPAAAGPDVAADRELDGPHGNPEIRLSDPRDWRGPTMKGRKFSEAPADYLDLLAERFDFFAKKADETNEKANNGKPRAVYLRLDAARARGWSARIRSGKHTPNVGAPADNVTSINGWDPPSEDWAQGGSDWSDSK